MSQPIYFDITDIVRYAEANDRVSGIQRVQFNLIGHLVGKHGGEAVRCVFLHPIRKAMVELDPAPLFRSKEFDATILLQQLGLEPKRRFFPSRRSIKRYLHRYSRNKAVRALRKVDVYASAVFMPRRLASMGLSRQRMRCTELPLRPVDRLPPGAAYVILSANILVKQVLGFAKQHLAQGGDLFQLVYDLIAHKHPEYFTPSMVRDYEEWLHEVAAMGPRVICISEWTARDLREFLGPRAVGWDIQAIPLSHEFDGFARNADVDLPAIDLAKMPDGPFALCVGTLEVRKNGMALLEAWQRLLDAGGRVLPTLVFAGKRGWLIEKFMERLAGNPGLAAHVRILDSPTDAQLAWLYRHAQFTLYPSFYEGWGLPVGESAWFGTYCIASKVSSVPEVCGDLIDYVDPNDPADIVQCIERAVYEPDYVRRRADAISRAPLRRWSDLADDIHRLVSTPRSHVVAQPHMARSTPAAGEAPVDETTDRYAEWKGWHEAEFGQFNRHMARYYDWHVQRALGDRGDLKVLEVGFGNGAFLGFCRSRGWQATAVELDAGLRERAVQAGFPTAPDIQRLPPAERFDLIALFDVLEHVPAQDLVGFLRTLRDRLLPDGSILLRVPNGDSPFGRRHQHGDLTHVTSFGEFKLRQLAQLCDLKIVAIGESPWHAQQSESRNFRCWIRAVARAAINRLFGFAYFGRTVDLSSNLAAVLAPCSAGRAEIP